MLTTRKNKNLSHKDEMLLTLMRLRLAVLNEDLADRFGISPTICSNTFTTWIKLTSKVLGDASCCVVAYIESPLEITCQTSSLKQIIKSVVLS